mmetsp:Transcript_27064/g.43746  ORF Transcript_27064/g.43746 Transcript_27064/m.43746 type:complete len:126 (+) Transcript_27064:74-451(+)|eukprot:jgi/Bigna1/74652/fgenesh1_pg.30_\
MRSLLITALLLFSCMAAAFPLQQYVYGYGACVVVHTAYGALSNVAEEVEDITEEVQDIKEGGVVEDVSSSFGIAFHMFDLIAGTPLYALQKGWQGATMNCPLLLLAGTIAHRKLASSHEETKKAE